MPLQEVDMSRYEIVGSKPRQKSGLIDVDMSRYEIVSDQSAGPSLASAVTPTPTPFATPAPITPTPTPVPDINVMNQGVVSQPSQPFNPPVVEPGLFDKIKGIGKAIVDFPRVVGQAATDIADDESIDAGMEGAAVGMVNALPFAGRATRRIEPSPIDKAPASNVPGVGVARVAEGLGRGLGEAVIAGYAGGIPGMAAAAGVGAADDLAYEERLRKIQAGEDPGGFLPSDEVLVGLGIKARDENDTGVERLARGATPILAAASAGLGAKLAKGFELTRQAAVAGGGSPAASVAAEIFKNLGVDVPSAIVETGVNAIGQGLDPTTPEFFEALRGSAGIAALASSVGSAAGARSPGVDIPANQVADVEPPPLPVQAEPPPLPRLQVEPPPLPPQAPVEPTAQITDVSRQEAGQPIQAEPLSPVPVEATGKESLQVQPEPEQPPAFTPPNPENVQRIREIVRGNVQEQVEARRPQPVDVNETQNVSDNAPLSITDEQQRPTLEELRQRVQGNVQEQVEARRPAPEPLKSQVATGETKQPTVEQGTLPADETGGGERLEVLEKEAKRIREETRAKQADVEKKFAEDTRALQRQLGNRPTRQKRDMLDEEYRKLKAEKSKEIERLTKEFRQNPTIVEFGKASLEKDKAKLAQREQEREQRQQQADAEQDDRDRQKVMASGGPEEVMNSLEKRLNKVRGALKRSENPSTKASNESAIRAIERDIERVHRLFPDREQKPNVVEGGKPQQVSPTTPSTPQPQPEPVSSPPPAKAATPQPEGAQTEGATQRLSPVEPPLEQTPPPAPSEPQNLAAATPETAPAAQSPEPAPVQPSPKPETPPKKQTNPNIPAGRRQRLAEIADGGDLTTSTNEDANLARSELGLTGLPSHEKKKDRAAFQKAIDSGYAESALERAEDLIAGGKPLSDEEQMGFAVAMASRKGMARKIREKLKNGNLGEDARIALESEHQAIVEEMEAITTANRISGTETGRALRARRFAVDLDLDPVGVIIKAKKANPEKALAPEERAKLVEMAEKLEAKDAELKGAFDRIQKLETEIAVGLKDSKGNPKKAKKLNNKRVKEARQRIAALDTEIETLLKANCHLN